MRIKLLRRFCADEVKLMLERMDSNFEEEFASDDSKWDLLLPHGEGFRRLTTIEQHCIRSEYIAHREKYRKAQVYQEILERAMSPAKTKWEYRDSRTGVQAERPKGLKPTSLLTPTQLEAYQKQYAHNPSLEQIMKYGYEPNHP